MKPAQQAEAEPLQPVCLAEPARREAEARIWSAWVAARPYAESPEAFERRAQPKPGPQERGSLDQNMII